MLRFSVRWITKPGLQVIVGFGNWEMKVSQIHRSKDSFWEYLPNQLWIITLRRFLLDKDVFIRRSELANSFGREFSAIRAMVRWNRQLKRKLWNGKFPEHQSLWWSKLFITLDTCLWFVLLNSFYSKPTDWAKIYYYYYYYYYLLLTVEMTRNRDSKILGWLSCTRGLKF